MAAVHSIDDLLTMMEPLGASDLHVSAGSPPVVRVHGELQPLEELPPLTPEETQQLLYRILSTEQQKRLEVERQIDLSYSVSGLARFRVNVFFQRSAVGAAFRLIPYKILTLEELRLPASLHDFAEQAPRTRAGHRADRLGQVDDARGVDRRDQPHRAAHILTIEDPIEFLHRHRRCLVNQREIGTDARGFAEALRAALRQDPDVILLGEMRDLETISTALTAAETGHLVFAHAAHARRGRDDRQDHRRLPGRAAGPGPRPARRRASRESSPRRCCRPPTARAASRRSRS